MLFKGNLSERNIFIFKSMHTHISIYIHFCEHSILETHSILEMYIIYKTKSIKYDHKSYANSEKVSERKMYTKGKMYQNKIVAIT